MNTFEISKSCIIIARRELIFEQYRMTLKMDKYDIEVQNDDAIKSNRILFDFRQQMFNPLDGLYLYEKFLLIDTIIENQSRKQSTAEAEILNRKKVQKQKKSKVHPSFLRTKAVLWIIQPEQVEQQVTHTIQIWMRTQHNGVNQAVVKWKILEWVKVGEIVMLRIQTNKCKEKLVKRKRLK